MDRLQGLENMKLLIGKGWTKYAYARDERGVKVSYDSPMACQFCLIGAGRASGFSEAEVSDLLVPCITDGQRREIGASVIGFNDYIADKQEDVIGLIDCAIKNAKGV